MGPFWISTEWHIPLFFSMKEYGNFYSLFYVYELDLRLSDDSIKSSK